MSRAFFISSEAGGRAGNALSGILRDICTKIDENNYDISRFSADIKSVCVVVCCFPDDLRAAGFGKPRKLIKYKEGTADIRLPMPYVDFINADDDTKYLMAVRNITDSLKVICERCKKSRRASFDCDGMTDDLLARLGIPKEQLENIVGVCTD
ncbi:Imm44 family immunity protein [uncultured Ruminococcus sp.]|uniref:Imm44 family immunity protein n=1 Tax=uncultured Ruminococcus sp. TaxID=165186 RepID=UPI0025EAEADB|nr:Imm44 family immunity protein [uncultured Ruminococcus sp.]